MTKEWKLKNLESVNNALYKLSQAVRTHIGDTEYEKLFQYDFENVSNGIAVIQNVIEYETT